MKEFIEQVAKNYDVIKEGSDRNGNKTYRLLLTDKHNNTLMIELSKDGSYWNVNTAGVFKNLTEKIKRKCITAILRLSSLPKLLKHRKPMSIAAHNRLPA